MRFSLILSALMGSLAVALPNPVANSEEGRPAIDVAQLNAEIQQSPAGAWLYKRQYLNPGLNRNPTDYTHLPGAGRGFCTDLSNLYGNWDNATRSLAVEPGHRCCFHRVVGCAGDESRGEVLTLGEKDRKVVKGSLSGGWDKGIRSAICTPIE